MVYWTDKTYSEAHRQTVRLTDLTDEADRNDEADRPDTQ